MPAGEVTGHTRHFGRSAVGRLARDQSATVIRPVMFG
jgi:hypothetical protein